MYSFIVKKILTTKKNSPVGGKRVIYSDFSKRPDTDKPCWGGFYNGKRGYKINFAEKKTKTTQQGEFRAIWPGF